MSDDKARWQRLQEIVHSAIDRPAEARAAFLDEACGGDETLRLEAASLVEQADHADGFLVTPIAELAAHAVTYSPGTSPDAAESRNLIGLRIGTYEIRTRIGAGGMGEVYRAHDHSLHRDVAIKVLPAAFITNPERLARFEREARLLASLNHPHIGAVYGLEGSGDLRGIVLELIDGETLEARLAKGPIPVAQCLALALQIARALDHAHQHRVMHRDLKPANIMLTKGGAKLLDFGLAKWGAPRSGYSPSPGSASARPEGVESVTNEGTILGTLHYMAPEQLEGKRVDARADVFAFGAVLYEMLTGRRAFDGGSAAAVMASVLNTEPAALDTVKRLASPAVERIVRKCLAKDPDDRWQTFRDLADELKWIADESERWQPSAVDRGPRVGMNRWVMLGGAALALVFAGWVGWRIGTASEPSPPRALVTFPMMPSLPGGVGAFDISPDGNTLVYVMGIANERRLYVRRFDQTDDVMIPGSENADEVAFSPDGQWVAFYSGTRLLKVNVKTMTAPVLVWDGARSMNRSTAWLDDRTIVTTTDIGERDKADPLMRVRADGGAPQAVSVLADTEVDHHNPQLLPGGKALIFTVHHANGDFKVVAQAFSPEEQKVVGERRVLVTGFDPQYVSTGHLVFARERTILAVPFDADRLQVTGPEVTLVEGTTGNAYNGNGGYRVSKSGTLVFRPRPPIHDRRFVWVDRNGTETPGPLAADALSSPSISPDGKQLAYAREEVLRRDIWTYEFATEKITRITREGDNKTPIWTPDGQRLTYSSTRGGPRALFSQYPGNAPEQLVSGNLGLAPGAWSPDGKVLTYSDESSVSGTAKMYSVGVDGNRTPTPLMHGRGGQRAPSVSPDGRWVAFTSDETNRTEIYVANYPQLTSRHQVSVDGGREAKWSRDGREIVYRSGRRMFAVPVDITREFSSGKPRVLFEANHVVGGPNDLSVGLDYAYAPDGRFLMIKPGTGEQTPVGVRVVLHWLDEVARRVPTPQ